MDVEQTLPTTGENVSGAVNQQERLEMHGGNISSWIKKQKRSCAPIKENANTYITFSLDLLMEKEVLVYRLSDIQRKSVDG